MQRRSLPSQVLLCYAVLCCCAVQHPLPRHCPSLLVVVRVLRGEAKASNVGELVLLL
jgi:hypothetical protein